VLGDTAFDAESVQEACADRHYDWITPVNSERVLAGRKPRPKVRSLVSGFGPANSIPSGSFRARANWRSTAASRATGSGRK